MIKNSLLLALIAFASGTVLSSCNTTAGFGEDLQKVGSKLETKADDTGGTGTN
ncbi:entericidin A/B family lipoprotein [Haloferula sp.]|uniref:entericidin A/B family lipoprotein n=1 Tax=Haloferula sp. TaxID=2497595 RepID=UPI003C76F12C